MTAIRVICRIDKHTGEPILFLPDTPANPGRVSYYTRIGQHGEASLAYYQRNTRPAKADECKALKAEYASLPGGRELIERKRLR